MFEGRPLKATDGAARFEGFNPRVGTITPFKPSDPRSFQSIFPTNVQRGIVNTTAADQVVEDDDYESIQPLPDDQVNKSGIAKLFEFLQKFSPSGLAKRGLDALGSVLDFSDSPNYRPATISVYGYTPQELDRMNALGGYYSEPMRAYRRNVNRISNLMRRAAAGKDYSQKNLDKLMAQAGMGDVDTGAMIDSIKANAGYEGGFDPSTGNYNDPLDPGFAD